ncbi:S1C family serine protease [Bacillus suaedaesalsae]|uniref:Trypsin-like peptidase domain-containing protein n=1 Tax=Bacillus suaedaesalsae TaxID=2810349 RepID=A0ABS2DJW6_9BACI|nr:trypsin-like peptidase domain-containing protein [Bacillus suaedaesalsae]MBM6618789.1 trypsin-like peptidase domain-containing protein [Bacillus suaedaesalsae]
MGYYDEHTQLRLGRKRKFPTTFVSSLAAACIGSAVTLAVVSPNSLENKISDTKSQADVPAMTNSIETVSMNFETQITKAIEKASGAVVGVINIQNNRMLQPDQEAGTGSGVIYKKEDGKAYVVTNSHVVNGASKIEISLEDGKRVSGKLLGEDIYMDLAVIEIDAAEVKHVATFASSDNIKLGEPVLAIGNPLGLEFSGSVTQGIISGLDRSIPVDYNQDGSADWEADVLQTDAAINPGNSGGALVNANGDVIGINSMKINQTSVEGIGFSIPISIAIPIIESLEVHGKVIRPYLGVATRSLADVASYHWQHTFKLPSDVTEGVFIEQVGPNSPAAKAGLQELDVIVKLDGEKIESMVQLRKYLYQKKKVGDTISISYYRNGELTETKMTLESIPGES